MKGWKVEVGKGKAWVQSLDLGERERLWKASEGWNRGLEGVGMPSQQKLRPRAPQEMRRLQIGAAFGAVEKLDLEPPTPWKCGVYK